MKVIPKYRQDVCAMDGANFQVANGRAWTSIVQDGNSIGAFVNGEDGFEVYDTDDELIGIFADEDAATYAVLDCWETKSNGREVLQQPAPHSPEPEPEPSSSTDPADGVSTNTVVVDHPTVQQRTTQFLSRVVPWPNPEDDGASGYVNVHWTIVYPDGRPGMAGKPVRTVTEFLRLVAWILRLPSPGNIYFCLSLQRKRRLDRTFMTGR